MEAQDREAFSCHSEAKGPGQDIASFLLRKRHPDILAPLGPRTYTTDVPPHTEVRMLGPDLLMPKAGFFKKKGNTMILLLELRETDSKLVGC